MEQKSTTPLLMLTATSLIRNMKHLANRIIEHRRQATQAIQDAGVVLPCNTFFQQEFSRYNNILPHLSEKYVVSVREALQNSADAGTTSLKIETYDLTGQISPPSVQALQTLDALPQFVSFEDDGRWCPEDKYDTYNKCITYFLKMNGSSKDGQHGDGGFGLGRFVILFCSPLWLMTVRQILIIGHYNCYVVLCRRCNEKIKSESCAVCNLHERDTPAGTTFFIHYPGLHLDNFAQILRTFYLNFCQVTFPIYLNNQVLPSVTYTKTIHKDTYFVVSKTDAPNYNQVYPVYLVCTASGVPMFSRFLYNRSSEKGFFVVTLAPSINYLCFDQARQSLIGPAGCALNTFFSQHDGVFTTSDVNKDILEIARGPKATTALTLDLSGVSLLPPQSSSSSSCTQDEHHTRDEHHTQDEHHHDVGQAFQQPPYSPAYSPTSPVNNAPEEDEKGRGEHHTQECDHCFTRSLELRNIKQYPGALQCYYFFRGGKTMETIDAIWRPGHSQTQIYVLLIWTSTLRQVLRSLDLSAQKFQVGFVFDASTLAMVEHASDPIFYINPELLVKEVGDLKKSKRHHIMAYMLARALHEVSHLRFERHDQSYASELTNNIYQFMAKELKEGTWMKMDLQIRRLTSRVFYSYQAHQKQQPKTKRAKITKVSKSSGERKTRTKSSDKVKKEVQQEPPTAIEVLDDDYDEDDDDQEEFDDDEDDEDWIPKKDCNKMQGKRLGKRARQD
jgi:hypothetical protein